MLDIGIEGSNSNSVLDIQGNAIWGGTLKLSSLSGFMPNTGDIFKVALFSGTYNGQFASLDTSSFAGITFNTIYDSHDVSLKVTSVNIIPIPPALWLFGSGLVSMVLTGIRKKDRVLNSFNRSLIIVS